MKMVKQTKIVCTIGPACKDAAMLEKMVMGGMNVARLNFSHGTHEEHAAMIATIRAVAEKTGEPVTILQDLQGPKIRVGELPKEGVMLTNGATVIFSTAADAAAPTKIPVTYAGLHKDVKPGDAVLLDDGLLEVKVIKVEGMDIFCEVVNGGILTSHKGFNLPTASLSVPAITEKDEADVRFGVSQGVDWVALSFVRSAKDIEDLRAMIQREVSAQGVKEKYPINIIAKIEKHEAIKNIDEIIAAVDGIMVARGDLGIETPAEEVPLAQKRIIAKCLAAAKPVIVATQMLDSMIRNPRPTRAEVSDIANAVIDHTDAVMLSGETASGKYPLEAVETMARVIKETEASAFDDLPVPAHPHENTASAQAVSEIATILAKDTGAKAALVVSADGGLARLVSSHRPELPILVATDDARTQHQLNLSWGVRAFAFQDCTTDELAKKGMEQAQKEGWVKKGNSIVLVTTGTGNANRVEIREVE